jgi:hypothetical protein
MIEDLHHLTGKTALWKLRRPLHKQYDVVRLHFVVNELLDAHIRVLLRHSLWGRYRPASPETLIYVPQTVVHPK